MEGSRGSEGGNTEGTMIMMLSPVCTLSFFTIRVGFSRLFSLTVPLACHSIESNSPWCGVSRFLIITHHKISL